MRNSPFKFSGAVLAGLAGLAVPLLFSSQTPALAQDGKAQRNMRPAVSKPTIHSDHQSVMHITERDGYPLHRAIRIGRSKSTLVELSRELRDVIVSSPDLVDAVVQSSVSAS